MQRRAFPMPGLATAFSGKDFMPLQILADTNIYDAVAADPKLKQLIEQCMAAGLIGFKITHIQFGQLEKIPANRDIGQSAAINAERTGVSVFLTDYSRAGEDRLASAETSAAFAAIQKGNPKHTEDAMIGATAIAEANILVTNDTTFRKRFEAIGSLVKVMSSAEFKAYLTGALQTSTP
jgi:predicted nucleic acid-binding protein